MNSEYNFALPLDVQQAYDIDDQAIISRLSGGQVNETILVDQNERKLVLRRLAPILGESTIRNTGVIGRHLTDVGWEAPTIEPTASGKSHVLDGLGRMWHGMPYIDSDDGPPRHHSPDLALKAGEVLGSWHAAVKPLDYLPESLPYFHDTDYIAKKMQIETPLFPDQTTQELAHLFLKDYSEQPEKKFHVAQIIHGDPKLDNMLYRDGHPFTLIDFDCVMHDSVWTDIGDFLRSLSGKVISTGRDPADTIVGFIEGYLGSSESKLSSNETTYYALQATRCIACELGMRYLSDIVDGRHYFSWDKKVYQSRAEALLDKAYLQYEILQTVHKYLNEGKD